MFFPKILLNNFKSYQYLKFKEGITITNVINKKIELSKLAKEFLRQKIKCRQNVLCCFT